MVNTIQMQIVLFSGVSLCVLLDLIWLRVVLIIDSPLIHMNRAYLFYVENQIYAFYQNTPRRNAEWFHNIFSSYSSKIRASQSSIFYMSATTIFLWGHVNSRTLRICTVAWIVTKIRLICVSADGKITTIQIIFPLILLAMTWLYYYFHQYC